MSFKDFQLHPKINAGIDACAYTEPTPIQKEAIPPILAGRDIIGLAQTGTGKTAAFVLPLLQRLLNGPRKKIRALIVAPTRELAEQIHDNIEKMAQKTALKSAVIYGGVGKHPQISRIRSGVEIVVACPGRLLDLFNEKVINLSSVEVLILDEADHMFDKGFLPDIRRIIRQLPRDRQSLVFSATMPKEIRTLAEEVLRNPVTVQINHTLPAPTISHALFQVAKEQKTSLLKSIIKEREMTSTLVFTRTKHRAKSLALHLQKAGYSAASLQGNLSQQKRQQALDGFRDGTFKILVATDIAARGIDVLGISHVINYDVPDTAETYTHRTGRTGRATRSGQALSFASQEDSKMISLIEHNLGKKMLREVPPVFAYEKKEDVCKEKETAFSHQIPQRRRPIASQQSPKKRLVADSNTRKRSAIVRSLSSGKKIDSVQR
ncbi:MAG: DEAD/DEAH box helicase [Desulfamplus sp.]|nr:DEAD/DEAH box helicase [Desulfamplus sp.]